ncbi:MAG: hypothetical protein WBK88_02760 [Methanothrix sp.]
MGVSLLVASAPAGGWVSGTGAIDISRSVVDRINEFEHHTTLAGDGSLEMGRSGRGSPDLERGVSPRTFSLSYAGEVPLVGMKRIEKGSSLGGGKTTIQEAFSAHQMEKVETTSIGTGASQLVGTDTKLSFNGTYITTSKSHQIFASDISSQRVFTGKFDIQQQISFGGLADRSPSIALAVLPQDCFAEVGALVTRNYQVANVGNVPIQGLVLVDSRVGTVPLDKSSLNPGEVASAVASFAVGDERLPGPLNDTVRVTGSDFQGKTATASAAANVSLISSRGLSLEVIPQQECAGAGEAVAFIYQIENVGDLLIEVLHLNDSIGDPLTINATLMPNESLNLTRDGILPDTDISAPLSNDISLFGVDSMGSAVFVSSEVVLQAC